ncbi:RNA polymerase factor sigma-54 [Floccifex sp.]|uniref:RNA polymerase factor sigma-54 n=1 Tax=Floccifex sp. TaxID=2815810 RepID=UPI003F0E6AF4
MKTSLVPQITLKQTIKFNKTQQQMFRVLSKNSEQLKSLIKEMSYSNPFISLKEDSYDLLLEYQEKKPDLKSHILNQIRLMDENIQMEVIEYLLSSINGNGYFDCSLEEMIQQSDYTKEQIEAHIQFLRQCEPYGLFAFDLKECLQLQCIQSEKAESETAFILCSYLELLANRQFEKISKITELEIDEIEEGFDFIKNLHPKPGSMFSCNSSYLMPECIVKVEKEDIHIEMINVPVSIEVMDCDTLKEQRQEAMVLMNAIQKRNMTLLQIMNVLCDIQKDFFLCHGPIQYCTLKMIAQRCGLAISTVSRAVSNKSFEFENEYYEMDALLDHGKIEKKRIQKRIRELIQNEDKEFCLSDEKIRKILLKEGIQVSRRTITKYREELFILNSRQRRIWKE